MKKICVVVSSDLTVKAFLLGHLRALSKNYDVTVVANTADKEFLTRFGINAHVVPVFIERKPSLLRDIMAVWHLYRLFRRKNFDLIYSVTPKAGLLAMLAGSMRSRADPYLYRPGMGNPVGADTNYPQDG
jgi:hypothetical protein